MYVIMCDYSSKNGKSFELVLKSHGLPYIKTWTYPDKKQLRSKMWVECESMDNQHIKQAVEASYILRYIVSNKIAVLLSL